MTATHFLEGKFTRAGADDESLTVPAVLSSELPVNRNDRNGGYIEVLRHSYDSINLSRFPLPVIESHDQGKVNIGIAEKPQIIGGKLRATVRFGASTRAKELFNDIKAGIVRNLSIGYQIDDFTETKQTTGETVVTATRWQPFETSIVSIPADPSAGFYRNLEMTTATQNTDSQDDQYASGVNAERERIRFIQDAGKSCQISARMINDFISRGVTQEVAGSTFLEIAGARHTGAITAVLSDNERANYAAAGSTQRSYGDSQAMHDPYEPRPLFGTSARHNGGDDLQEAMSDGLLIRSGIRVDNPHVAAQDFARMRMVDIAETFVKSRWGFGGMKSAADVIKRALTTSDFPLLLENIAAKAVMSGYDSEPASHTAWVKVTEVVDFKQQKRVALSGAPDLDLVHEGGEYTYGALSEKGESFAIQTYGKIINVSRQALINDDLEGLVKIPIALGRSASRLEADKVYAILTGNPNMGDGTALFHANHKNLQTGAALSITSLGAARAAMRLQKGLNGAILNIVPRFLIVPAALEAIAEQLVTSLVDPARQNATRQLSWIRGLQIVVDARLDASSASAWYLAADYNQVDTIELAYLQGQRGAFLDSQETFNIDGTQIKCRLDFATAPIDWIGLIKNPGA